jgi:hypothetical protein
MKPTFDTSDGRVAMARFVETSLMDAWSRYLITGMDYLSILAEDKMGKEA